MQAKLIFKRIRFMPKIYIENALSLLSSMFDVDMSRPKDLALMLISDKSCNNNFTLQNSKIPGT